MNDNNQIQVEDCGRIKLFYLKKVWNHYHKSKTSQSELYKVEWKYIIGVFNTLRLALEPTVHYLVSINNSFEEFENWIEENGSILPHSINHFNKIVSGEAEVHLNTMIPVFTSKELKSWDEDGYIILKNAISQVDCKKTVDFIYQTIDAKNDDPRTWYQEHPLKKGIMIQLFNSEILDKNRSSSKIESAFKQLWNRNDLIVNIDRVSFNPPETEFYQFPGPNLHWDVSLKQPIPYGLQGLLYLTDTEENQGAFTVVPGFQNKISDWLNELDTGIHPRDHNVLNKLEKKPIAAKAGDFIIWNQCLPHGSSPNTSSKPRIVQYINYQPLDMEVQTEWI